MPGGYPDAQRSDNVTGRPKRLCGGAIYIESGGRVMATNCVFTGNTAAGANGANGWNGNDDPNYGKYGYGGSPGTFGVGGAILNLGDLIAVGCQFTNNSATGGNGGSGGYGGSGSYRGGNGGGGGNGALAFGGAIYNAGSSLVAEPVHFRGQHGYGRQRRQRRHQRRRRVSGLPWHGRQRGGGFRRGGLQPQRCNPARLYLHRP